LKFDVSQILVNYFDGLLLHFQIYNNNLEVLDSTSTINVFGIEKEMFYYLSKQMYRANEDVYIKKGVMISERVGLKPLISTDSAEFLIKLQSENFKLSSDDTNFIAVDLSIHKKMHENIYHQVYKCLYPPIFACVNE